MNAVCVWERPGACRALADAGSPVLFFTAQHGGHRPDREALQMHFLAAFGSSNQQRADPHRTGLYEMYDLIDGVPRWQGFGQHSRCLLPCNARLSATVALAHVWKP